MTQEFSSRNGVKKSRDESSNITPFAAARLNYLRLLTQTLGGKRRTYVIRFQEPTPKKEAQNRRPKQKP